MTFPDHRTNHITVTTIDGSPVLTCHEHPGWHPRIRGDSPEVVQAKADYHRRNPTHYLPDTPEGTVP